MAEQPRDNLWQRAVRYFQAPPRPPLRVEVAIADTRRGLYGHRIKAIPYNPDDLVARKGIAIYDLMRRDDQIKGALSVKKFSVLRTGWRIDPDSDKPADKDVAEFVHAALERMAGSFEQDLYEIMTALDYGFSVTEKIYELIERGPWQGKVGYKALKTVAPHDIDFEVDEHGNLISVQQLGTSLPTDKFVIFSYNSEFSNWYGTSDLRAAYDPWWVKHHATRWLGIYLEKFAVPMPVAKVPANLGDPDQTKLRNVLENLQANTALIIPDGITLEFPKVPEKGAEQLTTAIDLLNVAIARAILMPHLLGMTAPAQVGSLARARKDFELFMEVVEQLRLILAEQVITEQVVKPLVGYNFPHVDPPRFRFNSFSQEVQADLLKLFLEAVKIDAIGTTPEDEVHIRDITGFPARTVEDIEREQEEEQQRLPTRPPQPPSQQEATAPIAPQPAEPVAQPDKDKDARFALRPPEGTAEARVDFVGVAFGLDRIEQEAAVTLAAALQAQRDQLISFVQKRFAEGSHPRAINELQLRQLDEIQRAMREFVRAGFEYGRYSMDLELRMPRPFAITISPERALKFFDQKALYISGLLRDELLAASKQILLNALKTGEVIGDTIIKLRELYAPFIGDGVKAVLLTAYRLETIIRTNLTEAFNEGRRVLMQDPQVQPLIAAVRYSAVLDARTTPVCRHLDGRMFKEGDPALDKLTPPNHFNCRSILVPVLITDKEAREIEYITEGQIGKGMDLAGKGFV